MTAPDQVEQAREMWEQARRSMALARDRWVQLCEARDALIAGLRRAHFPVSEAARELERLIDEQARQYERALRSMENLCKACAELHEQLERSNTGPLLN
jgi:RecA/RadA recombinase